LATDGEKVWIDREGGKKKKRQTYSLSLIVGFIVIRKKKLAPLSPSKPLKLAE
jgi:hypothetical protein